MSTIISNSININMTNIKFIDTNRDFLHQIDLENLPMSQFDIQQELDTAEWQSFGMTLRQRFSTPKTPALQDITKFMLSDQLKRTVLDKVWEDTRMLDDWQITANDMMDVTSSLVSWVNDAPGYKAGLHLDPRLVVVTGWIYFAKNNDPDLTTEFYTDNNRSNPMLMETGFGKGWILANTNNMWHDGWNKTQNNRYSMSYFILLNTGSKNHEPNRPFGHFKDKNSYLKKYWIF
jgi:hypothetical protein